MLKRKFIGKNGSLGYKKNKTYILREHTVRNPGGGFYPIAISRIFGGGFCPYRSIDKFEENWEK